MSSVTVSRMRVKQFRVNVRKRSNSGGDVTVWRLVNVSLSGGVDNLRW